jgi:hypothetical protein
MGWLSGWSYRKSHVINSASGAGTNYQIRIKAHYGTGTDSGEDVYLNGHCRTDFGDVRFTDDDGTTLLDYWMESKVDSDYAIFWVEVADDLSSNNATIYVYYGKSDATTASNGDNTFLFFDDFNVDLSKWTVLSGTWTLQADGTVKAYSAANVAAFMRSATYTVGNARIRTKARLDTQDDINLVFRMTDANNFYVILNSRYTGFQYLRHFKCVGGSWTQIGTQATFNPGTSWHIYEERVTGSTLKATVDNANEISATDTQFTSGYVGFRFWDGGYGYVDWVFVSKYVDPEPSHGSWGNEEQAGGVTYEIYLDAISQSLATPSYETTYNIAKDASVAGQTLTASEATFNLIKDAISQVLSTLKTETMFNISKDAVVQTLSEVLVELIHAGIYEIFMDAPVQASAIISTENLFNLVKDAIAQAAATLQIIGMHPISKDAIADASTTPSLQQILGINKEALAFSVSTPLIQSKFGISPEATVKVLAEFTLIKPTEVKITKLFLILGDLAIQIQGG